MSEITKRKIRFITRRLRNRNRALSDEKYGKMMNNDRKKKEGNLS